MPGPDDERAGPPAVVLPDGAEPRYGRLMASRTRDHEPPAAPAAVAVFLGAVTLYLGAVIPAEATVRHMVLCAVFGIVAVLSGWRAIAIAGRRRGPRAWAWVGIAIAAVGLVSFGWQALVIATGGAVPPPPWAPYLVP